MILLNKHRKKKKVYINVAYLKFKYSFPKFQSTPFCVRSFISPVAPPSIPFFNLKNTQIQTKNPWKQANFRLSLSIIIIFFFLYRFMDKKIGRFFDSVGSFFSGADVIPWCDRDIIAVRSLSSFLSHVIRSSLRN